MAASTGLEKSGRIVAFCDWNTRFCDQKTWCSRNFAPKTRRPGASLRPDEHSSRPDSDIYFNKILETAFVSNSDERERRESRQLLVPAGGSRPKTVDVRSDLQASSCGPWPFALALPDPSIGRRSCMQSDIGKARFLTLKKALEKGMIGDDKEFSGKVCVKWKGTEFERQVRSESLIPRGDAIHAQATISNRNAPEGALLEQPTQKSTNTPGSADSLLRHVEITGDFDFLKITPTDTTFLPGKSTAESQHARTSNERNKVAPQVKCSWKRNKPNVMSTQRIPTSCIVAVKIG